MLVFFGGRKYEMEHTSKRLCQNSFKRYTFIFFFNYRQTESGCMTDVEIAYPLQLNIIKLQTKYKNIPFHGSLKKIEVYIALTIL